MKTRHDEILEDARAFHRDHPEVWNLFVRFTLELIERGFRNYGAKSIMERIRWETDTPDREGNSKFKINNNYTSFYARGFMKHYPEHKDFFRTRKQLSEDQPATGLKELGPSDYEYDYQ